MAEIPEPEVRITRYEVSCLPPDYPDANVFTLTVEWRGEDRWAVRRGGAIYDAEGNRSWGYVWEDGREPVTAEERVSYQQGYDAWMASHRFDLDTALGVAKKVAPLLTVNGWTVERVLADFLGTARNDPEQPEQPADATGCSRTGADDA